MKKQIPFNLEAEQSILSAAFINNSVMISLADQLNNEDFFDTKNQHIFQAMRKLSSEGVIIDYTTVYNELMQNGRLNEAGGSEYLLGIIDASATSNVDAYVDIVKGLSMKRKIINVAEQIVNTGYDGSVEPTAYVDLAEKLIFNASKDRKTSDFSSIRSIAANVQEKTEDNMNSTDDVTGLSTGFIELDHYTSGLHPGEFIILAARPAMGKSALAMNLATNVASRNKNSKASVAVFSLEMPSEQIVMRMIAAETSINSNDIKTGTLTPKQWQYFEAGIASLSKLNIHFSDSSNVTIEEIRARCRKLSQSQGLDLLIIDYLQLISPNENYKGSRQEFVSGVSRSLKQLARELEIPVIALSQLSREVEKRDSKKPMMADLRESGGIEQDADVILFLYRDEYYNKDSAAKGTAVLSIAKNRQGTAGVDINLLFEPAYSSFRNKTE